MKNELKTIKSKMVDNQTISNITKLSIDKNLISDNNPSAVFFDVYNFKEHLKNLSEAFPKPTLNAIALKANPVINILKIATKMNFGAECASLGELKIAKKAGFETNQIVYDSPTKTINEIIYALKNKIYLNIDNEQELILLNRLIKNGHLYRRKSIGLRINPELSPSDANKNFSEEEKKTITSLKSSKFGIPIKQARIILLKNKDYTEFISGLHVHIGSQRCPIEMILKGIKKVVDFAEILNNQYGYSIKIIDIGGGLPVKYKDTDKTINFKEYAKKLDDKIPQLKNYKLITEFGRSVFANFGWVISKVEYIKEVEDENNKKLKIAMIQIGGDMFVRTAYLDWYHEIIVLNRDGSIKKKNPISQSIAGPLCFSGDFIGHKRILPSIESGDWIVIKDAGAYTFSMWSYYNNRVFPKIYGYEENQSISLLHKGHSVDEITAYWE